MAFELFAKIKIEQKPSERTIDPKYAKMYEYKLEMIDPRFCVIFPLPENFDTNKIKVALSSDRTGISVQFPNAPPLLKGKLFAPVSDFITKVDKECFVVMCNKEKPEKWSKFIVDYFPKTQEIDPKSSFELFNEITDEKQSLDEGAIHIVRSCNFGYVQAMNCVAAICLSTGHPDFVLKGRELFTIAIDYFKNPLAMVMYADIVLKENAARSPFAISLYKRAIEQNFPVAHALLGRALSPLSDIKCDCKNAEEAVKELELGLSTESPMAYHELAMLYYYGVGVKKDQEKALKLQEKAKKAFPDVEPLDDGLGLTKGMMKVFFVLLIAITIGLFIVNKKK